jgi:hypothetical protein
MTSRNGWPCVTTAFSAGGIYVVVVSDATNILHFQAVGKFWASCHGILKRIGPDGTFRTSRSNRRCDAKTLAAVLQSEIVACFANRSKLFIQSFLSSSFISFALSMMDKYTTFSVDWQASTLSARKPPSYHPVHGRRGIPLKSAGDIRNSLRSRSRHHGERSSPRHHNHGSGHKMLRSLREFPLRGTGYWCALALVIFLFDDVQIYGEI